MTSPTKEAVEAALSSNPYGNYGFNLRLVLARSNLDENERQKYVHAALEAAALAAPVRSHEAGVNLDLIRRELTPASPIPPAGGEMVLVPREPTKAMTEAGFDVAFHSDIYVRNDGTIVVETTVARDVWRAMLAAARNGGE